MSTGGTADLPKLTPQSSENREALEAVVQNYQQMLDVTNSGFTQYNMSTGT